MPLAEAHAASSTVRLCCRRRAGVSAVARRHSRMWRSRMSVPLRGDSRTGPNTSYHRHPSLQPSASVSS